MRSAHAAAARRASYSVDLVSGFVLLVDEGAGRSITNDAEAVIEDLARCGALAGGARVLYRDTDGRWDELLHDGAHFSGFRPIGGVGADDAIRKATEVNRA